MREIVTKMFCPICGKEPTAFELLTSDGKPTKRRAFSLSKHIDSLHEAIDGLYCRGSNCEIVLKAVEEGEVEVG